MTGRRYIDGLQAAAKVARDAAARIRRHRDLIPTDFDDYADRVDTMESFAIEADAIANAIIALTATRRRSA